MNTKNFHSQNKSHLVSRAIDHQLWPITRSLLINEMPGCQNTILSTLIYSDLITEIFLHFNQDGVHNECSIWHCLTTTIVSCSFLCGNGSENNFFAIKYLFFRGCEITKFPNALNFRGQTVAHSTGVRGSDPR